MRISSNEVQEHKDAFAGFVYNRNDFNRRVPFEISRPSPFTMETSPSSFPPLLPDKRSTWKRVSFGRFSSQPIRLSVLKLDGSSFEISVKKKATVAKVKQAVEAAFSHLPRQGESKISWSHVWGQFSLCFEHMKLLRDRDPIARYGIKNGDQIHFVRNTPVYTLAGETSQKLTYAIDESEGSSSKSDSRGDMKNRQNLFQNQVNQRYKDFGVNKKCRSNWVQGLFPHRRQEGVSKRNDRVVNSTIRLGRPFPCDDANSNKKRDISLYSPNSFNDYVGGFGYPTGYCFK